ncbi:WhiB family transcriptional regulator [Rhodococcus sp. NPDC059968]|uniref:WhiB family transcriptional regulator n=1 Tax=Rhodococcus sp. NPDC059968 TaxID=3347017 RepID=UPI00366E1DED
MLPTGQPFPPAGKITTGGGDWQEHAACRGTESSVFFSPDGERRGRAQARRESRARRICQDCPVLGRCREHALAMGEPYGVWGGMTEADRRRHARRRLAAATGLSRRGTLDQPAPGPGAGLRPVATRGERNPAVRR